MLHSACSRLCNVSILPGLAPFLHLCTGPGTCVVLIAGDRVVGGEEGLGRLGREGLAGGRDRPAPPPLQLWPLPGEADSMSITEAEMEVQKMRLSPDLALGSPQDRLNRCLWLIEVHRRMIMVRIPSPKLSTCQEPRHLVGPSSPASEMPNCFHKTVSRENCYLWALCNFPIGITGCA